MMLAFILAQGLFAAAAPCDVVLPPDISQGSLVRGRGPVGSKITFAGRQLAQTASGDFVFGIAFDAAKVASLQIKGSKCSATLKFPVAQRVYATERVDGVPQNTVTPDPETAKRIALEAAMIQMARAVDSKLLYWQQPFQWPATGREAPGRSTTARRTRPWRTKAIGTPPPARRIRRLSAAWP